MAIHTPFLHRLDAVEPKRIPARLYTYALPLKNGETRRGLLLYNEETGSWGEAAPLPGRSPESFSQVQQQLLSLFSHPSQTPLFPSVQFCLEGALSPHFFPIEVPIWALYNYNPSILSQAHHYSHVKVKIGALSPRDAKKAVASLSGVFHLRLDCNRAFSYAEALEIFADFDNGGKPFCIEEPTWELSLLPQFPHPFALDETLEENPHFPLDSCTHLTTLILKPTLWGGREKCTPFLFWAKQRHKAIIFTGAYESGIGTLQIAALAQGHGPVGLQTHCALALDLLDPPIDLNAPLFVLNQSPNVLPHLIQEIAHGRMHTL